MISSNVNLLTDHQKKILLALIYNVLVSDQDYAEEEKYLFNNLIDLIDVSFNFNKDMLSKKDIIEEMKLLNSEQIEIYLDIVRLAILADGQVTEDEVIFFKDVFTQMKFSEDEIEEKVDYLKYGEKLQEFIYHDTR